MAYNKSDRPDSPMRRRGGRRRKKVCAFCASDAKAIDYKDVATLKNYISESSCGAGGNGARCCRA